MSYLPIPFLSPSALLHLIVQWNPFGPGLVPFVLPDPRQELLSSPATADNRSAHTDTRQFEQALPQDFIEDFPALAPQRPDS